jgi:hypothetical protein
MRKSLWLQTLEHLVIIFSFLFDDEKIMSPFFGAIQMDIYVQTHIQFNIIMS